MLKRLRLAFLAGLLAAVVFSIPVETQAAGNWGHQSAALCGFSTAQALSGGVTSSTISMGGTASSSGSPSDYFSRITLLMTVVWGTSVLLNVTGEYSWDGTNFFAISRCTSAVTHDCTARTWQFDPTDGTTLALEYPINARYVRFTFTDPGAGNGTIVVSAVKGK
jgi:hypothetical protein